MRLEQIHSSFVWYNESSLYFIRDYYDYVVNLIKDILFLNPRLCKNVIVGPYSFNFNNAFPIIRIGMNFEHTLVVTGGRDSDNATIGNIAVIDGNYASSNYLVRIENYEHLIGQDVIVDYSFPNLMNIQKSTHFPEYEKKMICISPLLYPIFPNIENRNISSLTTFINTGEPRRAKLLGELSSTFQHVNVNNCFQREALIDLYRNTKVLINIHQTDHHHTCEELRILPALLSGVVVICEESPLKEQIPYAQYIIWSSYEKILECLKNVLDNYETIHSQLFGDSVLYEILQNMETQNKKTISNKLFRVNTPYRNVWYNRGEYSETGLRVFHNAGFFSCCSVTLHLIIDYFNTYQRLPNDVDTERTLEWYFPKNNSRNNGDIFSHYFQTDECAMIEYDGVPVLYNEDYQFKNYQEMDMDSIVPFVRKYFSLSPEVLEIVVELEKKYTIDYEHTCALFLRGNDKATECAIPEYDFYRKRGREIADLEPGIRFLIQSDETEFLDAMLLEFSPSFCFRDEIRHIPKSNTTVDHVFRESTYEFSKRFLAIVVIMSKCKYVVCNYGNCSIWIAFFRGHLRNFTEYYAGC